ncbi:MAG TPA: thioesterase family protein [Anaerolineae bacterium]
MITSPLYLYHDVVRPEWLDYNNHMTEGYYAVVFANASDAFIGYIRMDAAYRERTNCSIYTVETHITYQRELKVDSPLRFATRLLGYDQKRIHIFHEMFHGDEGFLAATFEAMMLHVDLQQVKSAPLPADILAWLAEIHAAHKELALPDQVGRAISAAVR